MGIDVKFAAAYVRVSTDDQTEYSPGSQLKLVRDYARREGYVIPDEYVYQDDGISGKSADKRPNFRLMIATAKQTTPPFSCIFVWKYSRFARNQEEAIMYKNLLKKRGVDVRSISEPSTDSPFSSLIERIIEWMDEYYVINLAEEVKRGMKEKSLRGEAMGKPPFGYSVKDKIYVPNDDSPMVRRIFDMYASGASFREIAMQYPSITGQAVRYILSNPVYIGKTRWDVDGSHHAYRSTSYIADISSMPDGKHKAIIDRELWDTVQAKLSRRQTGPKNLRAGGKDYLFKGLVRCSACGSTLVDMTQKGKKRSLQCGKYSRGMCEESHYIQVATLFDLVMQGLKQAIDNDEFVIQPPKVKAQKENEENWGKYIAQEEARLKRAKTAYLDGLFTEDEYRSVKISVEDAVSKYHAMMQDEPKRIDVSEFKAQTVHVLDVLRSDVPDETKNAALRSVIDHIVFDKKARNISIFFAL